MSTPIIRAPDCFSLLVHSKMRLSWEKGCVPRSDMHTCVSSKPCLHLSNHGCRTGPVLQTVLANLNTHDRAQAESGAHTTRECFSKCTLMSLHASPSDAAYLTLRSGQLNKTFTGSLHKFNWNHTATVNMKLCILGSPATSSEI